MSEYSIMLDAEAQAYEAVIQDIELDGVLYAMSNVDDTIVGQVAVVMNVCDTFGYDFFRD